MTQPDFRKTLEELRQEWSSCTKCELGVRRLEEGMSFVFGTGKPRGILFVGEGPGTTEEQQGEPFVGRSGQFLKQVLSKIGFTDYYITNCVSCRSCGPMYNGEGQLVTRFNRKTKVDEPVIKDTPPTPAQIEACLPRLYEEIYLVDPLLIVALGGEAARTLRGRPVSITTERGQTETIEIPGAWYTAQITEKKHAWARKVHGQMVMPVMQNMVKYLMIPTVHPAFVLRFHGDKRKGNPLELFVADIKKAVDIYHRYMFEIYGVKETARDISTADLENLGEEDNG